MLFSFSCNSFIELRKIMTSCTLYLFNGFLCRLSVLYIILAFDGRLGKKINKKLYKRKRKIIFKWNQLSWIMNCMKQFRVWQICMFEGQRDNKTEHIIVRGLIHLSGKNLSWVLEYRVSLYGHYLTWKVILSFRLRLRKRIV